MFKKDTVPNANRLVFSLHLSLVNTLKNKLIRNREHDKIKTLRVGFCKFRVNQSGNHCQIDKSVNSVHSGPDHIENALKTSYECWTAGSGMAQATFKPNAGNGKSGQPERKIFLTI